MPILIIAVSAKKLHQKITIALQCLVQYSMAAIENHGDIAETFRFIGRNLLFRSHRRPVTRRQWYPLGVQWPWQQATFSEANLTT